MILLVDQVAAVTFVKYTKVSDFGKYVVAVFRHKYTGCPTDMVTTSDQILKIEKSHTV